MGPAHSRRRRAPPKRGRRHIRGRGQVPVIHRAYPRPCGLGRNGSGRDRLARRQASRAEARPHCAGPSRPAVPQSAEARTRRSAGSLRLRPLGLDRVEPGVVGSARRWIASASPRNDGDRYRDTTFSKASAPVLGASNRRATGSQARLALRPAPPSARSPCGVGRRRITTLAKTTSSWVLVLFLSILFFALLWQS